MKAKYWIVRLDECIADFYHCTHCLELKDGKIIAYGFRNELLKIEGAKDHPGINIPDRPPISAQRKNTKHKPKTQK